MEVGKSADMIVTKDNPLDDLLALRHIESVIMRGHRTDHPTNKINEQVKTELDKSYKTFLTKGFEYLYKYI